MSDQPERPARRSPRLKDYDYGQNGAYFVTICTHNRENLFGEIVQDQMQLNSYGEIVWAGWRDLANHYISIELDAFVVMPNHVHAIVMLIGPVDIAREGLSPSPTAKHGVTEIVRALKSFSARRIHEQGGTNAGLIWQRSFHDHIRRSEPELNKLREYVLYNPAKWAEDTFYTLSESNK
jgi:REP element-mobilizing transposase RayT